MNTRRDIKTLAYVLRRTNYGEADRILNLITQDCGKVSAIAKGVRKEKSKLAGGVEMFSLTEVNVHFGAREMGVVTGARMVKYYGGILTDYGRLELASVILRKVSLAAESSESPEYFKIVDEGLAALDRGANLELVETWFLMNYAKAMGEQVNLYFDADGEKLAPDLRYAWDRGEGALVRTAQGEIDANAIKVMRLMLTASLALAERIVGIEKIVPRILPIARAVNKM